MKFQRFDFESNHNLISSINVNDLQTRMVCRYLPRQTTTFKSSAIPRFQNRPAVMDKKLFYVWSSESSRQLEPSSLISFLLAITMTLPAKLWVKRLKRTAYKDRHKPKKKTKENNKKKAMQLKIWERKRREKGEENKRK